MGTSNGKIPIVCVDSSDESDVSFWVFEAVFLTHIYVFHIFPHRPCARAHSDMSWTQVLGSQGMIRRILLYLWRSGRALQRMQVSNRDIARKRNCGYMFNLLHHKDITKG